MADGKGFSLSFSENPKKKNEPDPKDVLPKAPDEQDEGGIEGMSPEELNAALMEAQLGIPESIADVSDSVDDLKESHDKLVSAVESIAQELVKIREGLEGALKKFGGE